MLNTVEAFVSLSSPTIGDFAAAEGETSARHIVAAALARLAEGRQRLAPVCTDVLGRLYVGFMNRCVAARRRSVVLASSSGCTHRLGYLSRSVFLVE